MHACPRAPDTCCTAGSEWTHLLLTYHRERSDASAAYSCSIATLTVWYSRSCSLGSAGARRHRHVVRDTRKIRVWRQK